MIMISNLHFLDNQFRTLAQEYKEKTMRGADMPKGTLSYIDQKLYNNIYSII